MKGDHPFVRFAESTDLQDILEIFSELKKNIDMIVPTTSFIDTFPILKDKLIS